MDTIVVRALAKINLAIDVLGRKENGYHDIDMLTVPLKLHDSVEITPLGNTGDTFLYCDDPSIECDESNLAYKALEEINKTFSIKGNYRILLYKKIPVEAGLGGGSADAAAVIRALDHFIPASAEKNQKINELAMRIGSDVPFCLLDKPARVRGIGEIIEPIKVKIPYFVMIVKPNYGLSTKSVYEAYDLIEDSIRHPNIDELIQGLETGNEDLIKKNMINVLSVPAIKALPLIGDLLEEMVMMDLPLCGMSGTGSACFALSKDRRHLERAAHIFEKEGNNVIISQFNLDDKIHS
ncbi:MAG: 4-(cytidine 5'-diphospho)-2-C-methyl-D-erythritol kinase [Bacilli bacterium]